VLLHFYQCVFECTLRGNDGAASNHRPHAGSESCENHHGDVDHYEEQEKSGDDPGRCVAIEAGPGDKVVIPPGWAHYVVNADVNTKLIFGAWCDRLYGFDYTQMRAHRGLAWFPLVDDEGKIKWEHNRRYLPSKLNIREARDYPELDVSATTPIYKCFRRAAESVQWISDPRRFEELWHNFEP